MCYDARICRAITYMRVLFFFFFHFYPCALISRNQLICDTTTYVYLFQISFSNACNIKFQAKLNDIQFKSLKYLYNVLPPPGISTAM